jgi:hypothetical protein
VHGARQMQHSAAAPATHHAAPVSTPGLGAAVPFSLPGQGNRVFRGERARGGIRRPALILGAVLALTGCAAMKDGGWQMAEAARGAYEFYDAHLEREVVVGHDAQRGDYAEVRWSPRAKAEPKTGLSQTLKSGSSYAAANTSGSGVTSGKEVLR